MTHLVEVPYSIFFTHVQSLMNSIKLTTGISNFNSERWYQNAIQNWHDDLTDQHEAGIVAIAPTEWRNRPLWRGIVLRLTEIVCVCIEDKARFELLNQLTHTHIFTFNNHRQVNPHAHYMLTHTITNSYTTYNSMSVYAAQ